MLLATLAYCAQAYFPTRPTDAEVLTGLLGLGGAWSAMRWGMLSYGQRPPRSSPLLRVSDGLIWLIVAGCMVFMAGSSVLLLYVVSPLAVGVLFTLGVFIHGVLFIVARRSRTLSPTTCF